MDLWLPRDVRVVRAAPRIIDKSGRFTSPLSGNVRTVTRSGARWGYRLDFVSLTVAERARLAPFLIKQGGAVNRAIYSPTDAVQRGSFASAELLQNNSFSNGTAFWSSGADYAISVADRTLRCQRVANTVPSNMLVQTVSNLTQYQPVVLRALTIPGRGAQSVVGPQINGSQASNAGALGLRYLVYVPLSTSAQFGLVDFVNAGQLAGDYFLVPFISVSPCLIVDNGVNLLINSDTPGISGWTVSGVSAAKSGTITAPDASLNSFALTEAATNAPHQVVQFVSVTAPNDFTLSVFVQAGTRQWCFLQMQESVGSTTCYCYFNSSTGAIGTSFAGSNWSNVRVAAEPYGNGWFRFTLTARITSAATGLNAFIGSALVDNVGSFAGSASAPAIQAWRATLAQSSVPVRPIQTAGSANPPGTNFQSGTTLYVRGLPASQNGLLLPGDMIEINQELKIVTDALNSSAAGLGYLQFSPALRISPNEGDAVVINLPLGRFLFSGTENGWTSNPGIFTDASIDLVEGPT